MTFNEFHKEVTLSPETYWKVANAQRDDENSFEETLSRILEEEGYD